MSGVAAEEKVSLLVQLGALVAVVLGGAEGAVESVHGTAARILLLTRGCNPTIATVVLVGVLVILLTPADTIGAAGQRALLLGAVVGAGMFLGSMLAAAATASEGSGLQYWLVFVVPLAVGMVPAGLATRLATEALRAA